MNSRIEKDSIGKLTINDDKYYGINTQRAIDNFQIRVNKTSLDFIKQIARIKYVAAMANGKLGRLDTQKARAIKIAATEIIDGKWDDQFFIP